MGFSIGKLKNHADKAGQVNTQKGADKSISVPANHWILSPAWTISQFVDVHFLRKKG